MIKTMYTIKTHVLYAKSGKNENCMIFSIILHVFCMKKRFKNYSCSSLNACKVACRYTMGYRHSAF